MKHANTYWLITILISSCYTQPVAIYQIHTLKEVAPYITIPRTLVVFDIDNTLLMPQTDLGSDQWFSYMVQEQIKAGMDSMSAVNYVVPVYLHVRSIVDLMPTESELPSILEGITWRSEHVVCLTAQSGDLAIKTLEQLMKNQMHHYLCTSADRLLDLPHPCLYQQGVLFCGHNDKGAVLAAFLDSIGYRPEQVIVIDDKEKYLHAVGVAMATRGIACIGLRYGGCDHRVCSFDAVTVSAELQDFLSVHPLVNR